MTDEIEARVREMIRVSDIPAEVATALQDSLRYSIRMHTALASDDLALGATKIGGQPDLPQDISWPEWRGAPLNFLAQIRLADIAEYDPGELPHEGMLWFFFDYTNWGKPERESEGSLATVLYVPEGVALQRMLWPETLRLRERYTPLAMTSFSRELTAPGFESPFIKQFGYTEDLLYGYLENSWHSLAKEARILGGTAAFTDEIQRVDWRLLLQVDSDENGMTWGDVGRIYYGLPRQALAARDFSQTLAELQCTLPRDYFSCPGVLLSSVSVFCCGAFP